MCKPTYIHCTHSSFEFAYKHAYGNESGQQIKGYNSTVFSLILSTYVHMFENNKKAADLGNPISATRPWPNFVTSKPSPAPLEP
jgi:hypothetical protein